MKKFINEHPRLYWVIVILIAGLAFGIVTGIGCAKLEKAEAAIEKITWTGFESSREAILRDCPYVVQMREWQGNGSYYFFSDNTRGFINNNYDLDINYSVFVDNSNVVKNVTARDTYAISSYDLQYLVGSNYDYRGGYGVSVPINNIEYPIYEAPVPQYLVNAPYLEYQSVEMQSNYVNEKIHDIDEGYHIVNYKIAGQPMTPPDGYKVLYEYRVYLPTKDYFRQFFREDMLPTLESLNTMKSNIPKWRRNSVGSSDSRLWIFNLDRSIEAEKTNGDDVRIRLDYADIQTEIEEFNSVSLKEYYGFDDDAWGAYGKYIMAHLVVYRVDCIVYTYNTPDIYYGRNITVHFPPYLDKPIVTEYNGDYFNPDYDYDTELDAKIEQALKDAKEESDALLEEYKGMINNQENMFGSFDSEFADVGLWGALRGIGSGFLGLTGFITNFAVLIGGIFLFVPIAFQQYVGYTLLAILLIGLWKTIKG